MQSVALVQTRKAGMLQCHFTVLGVNANPVRCARNTASTGPKSPIPNLQENVLGMHGTKAKTHRKEELQCMQRNGIANQSETILKLSSRSPQACASSIGEKNLGASVVPVCSPPCEGKIHQCGNLREIWDWNVGSFVLKLRSTDPARNTKSDNRATRSI